MNTEREVIENEQAAYKAYVEWKQGKSDEVIFPVDGFKAGWQACLANKPSAAALQKRIEELEAVTKDLAAVVYVQNGNKYEDINTLLFRAENALKAGDVQAPEGWKLVPIVPTKHQLTVAHQHFDDMAISIDAEQIDVIYKAMIAAATTDTEGK